MSVLIDMLRDLDRRGKSPLMNSSLVAAIESVPASSAEPAKRSGALRLLLALGASILLGGLAWWLLWTSAPSNSHSLSSAALRHNEPAQMPASAAPVPLPAPAPEPARALVPTTVAAPAPAKSATAASNSVAKAASTGSGAVDVVPAKGKDMPRTAQAPAPSPPTSASIAQATQKAKAPNKELVLASGDTPGKPAVQSIAEPPAAPDNFVRLSGNNGQAQAELVRAYDLAQRGRDVEAIEVLQHSVREWPQHAESRSALATLLNERGQRKEALAVLLGGTPIDPGHFALTAARMQIELGDASGALSTLALVPQSQRNAEYHATAAAMAQRAERHDMAIEEFRRALASGKPRAIWWVGLGSSLEQIGQKAEALSAYRQAQGQGDVSSATTDFLRQRIAALSEPASATLVPAQGSPSVATHP